MSVGGVQGRSWNVDLLMSCCSVRAKALQQKADLKRGLCLLQNWLASYTITAEPWESVVRHGFFFLLLCGE